MNMTMLVALVFKYFKTQRTRWLASWLCLGIGACSSGEGSLADYVAPLQTSKKVKQLTELQGIVDSAAPLAKFYNPSEVNPFAKNKTLTSILKQQSRAVKTPSEVLQQYKLAELQYIGLIQQAKHQKGVIKAGASYYLVGIGSIIGNNRARVVSIKEQEINYLESNQLDFGGSQQQLNSLPISQEAQNAKQ